jgi:ATP-dependent 26S proteasome regulatory subunit
MELIYETWSRKRMFIVPNSYTQMLTIDSGLFAIKDYRDAVNQDDFNKAVRKVAESKKLEGKLEYQKL